MSESGFFKPLAAVAARLGFAGVFTDHLARLSGSRDERVASWARIELRAASKVAPAEFRKGD
jgi:hypothetical protein